MSTMSHVILVVSADHEFRRQSLAALMSDERVIKLAEDAAQAASLLEERDYHVCLLDMESLGEAGQRLLRQLCERGAGETVVAVGPVEADVEVFGRHETWPGHQALRLSVQRVLERTRMKLAVDYLRHEQPLVYRLDGIVAESPSMRQVLERVKRVAPTDVTVLLTGESGVGKNMVAGAIHSNSPRRDSPFVAVNCAALPETLLESELFGHEKGAFTGAHASRMGRLEQAHGGTLFLDEVGNMSPATQAKILTAVEEKVVQRVGGRRQIHVDVRIVAATNQDLAQAVAQGQFREDLFYRLNVASINIPPLRERPEDIVELAGRFLSRVCADLKRPALRLGESARTAMSAHAWPGNIRELRNVIERSALFVNGPELTAENLELRQLSRPIETRAATDLNLLALERWAIETALDRCDYVQRRAAALLGITPRNLVYKIRKHGLVNQRLLARGRGKGRST